VHQITQGFTELLQFSAFNFYSSERGKEEKREKHLSSGKAWQPELLGLFCAIKT
jgi:hypothetical protein